MSQTKNHWTSARTCILSAVLVLLPLSVHAVSIGNLTANTNTVGRYERYELTFNLTGLPSNYNPFRPDTAGDSLSGPGVDARAEVVTPSGKTKTVWGFFDVDYTYLGYASNSAYLDKDRIVPLKSPHWHIRYAPEELGTYRVTVRATDQSGTATSSQLTFTCVASDKKGFVRISSDGTRFVYSDGTPYIPFGVESPYGSKKTDEAMAAMKANGMNFIRRWLVNRDADDIFRELEGWSSYASDTVTYRSGKRSATRSITGGGVILDQSFIGCRPGTYYKAFIYLKTSSNFNGKVAVEVVEDHSDKSTKTYTGTQVGAGANWTLSEVRFQTAANAEYIHFKPKVLSGSTGTVWADDAGVYECDSAGNVTVDWNMVFNPSFEEWTPAQLRMLALGRFEHMLQLGEQYGIMVQPAVFDYRVWSASNPTGFYAKYFGDFFSDGVSIAQQKRVLRYLVARFSSYRSLLGWELSNEMDATYTDVRGNWIKGLADYIRSGDAQSHIVTNSLWNSPGDVKFAQMPELDINQVHYYLNTEERTGGQGVPGWWTQASGVVIDGTASNAYAGTKSLKFTANGGTPTENQTIYVQPGRSYTLRYRLKLSGISSFAAILRTYDVSGVQIGTPVNTSDTGSFGYTVREKAFTMPSNGTFFGLEFRITGSSGTAWIDNVEVVDGSTGRNVCYNGGFESPKFGDDEYEWALYNTVQGCSVYESGPGGTRKPWASGETGLMGANADLSYWARPNDTTKPRHDSTGIHLHNCIWAQLMASSSLNTPVYWWTGEYVMPYNLWGQWYAPSAFASKLPFYGRGKMIATQPYPADVQATSTDARIRVLGQQASNSAYIWISNSGYTWSRVVRDGVNPSAVSAMIAIPGFTSGASLQVDWYDTNAGGITRTETKTAVNGVLTLAVPSISKDVAVIITGSTAPPPPPPSPKISLQIATDKATALPGDVITYTVSYANAGNDTAGSVDIRLPVPANTTFVAGSASSGGVYESSSNSVRWTLPSVAAGASGQVVAKVKVN